MSRWSVLRMICRSRPLPMVPRGCIRNCQSGSNREIGRSAQRRCIGLWAPRFSRFDLPRYRTRGLSTSRATGQNSGSDVGDAPPRNVVASRCGRRGPLPTLAASRTGGPSDVEARLVNNCERRRAHRAGRSAPQGIENSAKVAAIKRALAVEASSLSSEALPMRCAASSRCRTDDGAQRASARAAHQVPCRYSSLRRCRGEQRRPDGRRGQYCCAGSMASPILAVFPRTPTAKCMTDRASARRPWGKRTQEHCPADEPVAAGLQSDQGAFNFFFSRARRWTAVYSVGILVPYSLMTSRPQ
jgi:hypothetical protein